VSNEGRAHDTPAGLEPWPDAYRSVVVIHHATVFPVVKTPCGSRGPATTELRYVSCEACRMALGLPPKAAEDDNR
jgi:hypothetical protein